MIEILIQMNKLVILTVTSLSLLGLVSCRSANYVDDVIRTGSRQADDVVQAGKVRVAINPNTISNLRANPWVQNGQIVGGVIIFTGKTLDGANKIYQFQVDCRVGSTSTEPDIPPNIKNQLAYDLCSGNLR
ncbi:hypothetical protein LC593_34045 [Nostoc sp. CHAB 5844]|nr:hypothetical protein [Nostoc sp. CHAB 5844]